MAFCTKRVLLRGQRVDRLVLGLLLGVRAGRTQKDEQQGDRDLPRYHVNSCVFSMFIANPVMARGGIAK